MWSKLKGLTRVLCVVCVLALLALSAVLTVGLLIPYMEAKSSMDLSGALTVLTCEDGSLRLQWPAGENAQGYEVQVVDAQGNASYSTRVTECEISLPELPADGEWSARVTSVHSYGEKTRQSKDAMVASLRHPTPEIHDLNWSVDHEQDTLNASFDMSEGDLCRVYVREDENRVLAAEVRDGKLQLRFGEGEQLAVPNRDQTLEVTLQLERTEGNAVYRSEVSQRFDLTRDDFLSAEVTIEQHYNGDNSYTFTWNEAKGAYYDVRMSEDGGKTWQTKAYISADHERSFTTPSLKAFTDYQISIVGVGGSTGSEFDSQSQIMQILTREKLLYSTIWAIQAQKVYADTQKAEELGTVPEGSAWCVLGQEGQWLKIRYNGQDAYIDSEYCMINLTEYLGNLCQYDITNSYSSIYLVHEYGIKNVSGTVITGYEKVKLDEDTYLVPLLFPTAQKLLVAGQAARARGYTLKIYDSFRPQKATDSIYWQTYNILGRKIPSQTFSGKVVNDLNLVGWVDTEEDFAPMEMSYKRLMTNNGAYSLSAFLAPGTSRHNFGVALDLTLVDFEGVELTMQTSMHDLSWYSAFERNNSNANTLYEIMSGAGFGFIRSEWWHYQDNDIMLKNIYKPLKNGVSWECWVADNNGWRYRLSDGSFLANCAQTIGEETFSFDENGYVIK